MDAQIKILNDFKKALVAFLDELITMFPREPDFILARILIKDKIPIENTVQFFTSKILPEKEYIKSRDDDVFETKNILFGSIGLPADKAEYYKKFWKTQLDDEDRQSVWKWADAFVLLSEKYSNVIKN